MSDNKSDDPTLEAVRLLREGGYHEAAADLATKALQRATAAAAEQTQETAAAAPTHLTPAEAQRHAEGRAILDAMARDLGRGAELKQQIDAAQGWTSTPALEGS